MTRSIFREKTKHIYSGLRFEGTQSFVVREGCEQAAVRKWECEVETPSSQEEEVGGEEEVESDYKPQGSVPQGPASSSQALLP